MAGIDIRTYRLSPYTAPLVGVPVSYCTTKLFQSKVLPVVLDWSKPAFNTFAVQVNLMSASQPGGTIDAIVGVWIDNTLNNTEIVIQFTDTGYTVTCPPLDGRFFPVFSMTNIANIYNGAQSNTGVVTVIFTNFAVNQFEALNSQFAVSLSQGSSQASPPQQFYYPQILGDNHADIYPPLTALGPVNLPQMPVQTSGFYIITNLQIAIMQAYNTASASFGNLGIFQSGAFVASVATFVTTNMENYNYRPIYSSDDKYIIVPATAQMQANNNFTTNAGSYHLSFDFAWVLNR